MAAGRKPRRTQRASERIEQTRAGADRTAGLASLIARLRPHDPAWDRFMAGVTTWLAPGAEGDDLWRLATTPKKGRTKLWDIAQRMSRRLPASLRNPSARAALFADASVRKMSWVTYLREYLLPCSLLYALDSMMEPQEIRLGKAYVKGAAGRPAKIIPARKLTVGEFRQWLVARAYKLTESALIEKHPTEITRKRVLTCPVCHHGQLSGPTCPRCGVSIPKDAREERHSRPLIVSTEDEPAEPEDNRLPDLFSRQSEREQQLAALWAAAKPKEHQLLALIQTGLDRAAVRARMGMTPAAFDTLLSRLRTKSTRLKKNL